MIKQKHLLYSLAGLLVLLGSGCTVADVFFKTGIESPVYEDLAVNLEEPLVDLGADQFVEDLIEQFENAGYISYPAELRIGTDEVVRATRIDKRVCSVVGPCNRPYVLLYTSNHAELKDSNWAVRTRLDILQSGEVIGVDLKQKDREGYSVIFQEDALPYQRFTLGNNDVFTSISEHFFVLPSGGIVKADVIAPANADEAEIKPMEAVLRPWDQTLGPTSFEEVGLTSEPFLFYMMEEAGKDFRVYGMTADYQWRLIDVMAKDDTNFILTDKLADGRFVAKHQFTPSGEGNRLSFATLTQDGFVRTEDIVEAEVAIGDHLITDDGETVYYANRQMPDERHSESESMRVARISNVSGDAKIETLSDVQHAPIFHGYDFLFVSDGKLFLSERGGDGGCTGDKLFALDIEGGDMSQVMDFSGCEGSPERNIRLDVQEETGLVLFDARTERVPGNGESALSILDADGNVQVIETFGMKISDYGQESALKDAVFWNDTAIYVSRTSGACTVWSYNLSTEEKTILRECDAQRGTGYEPYLTVPSAQVPYVIVSWNESDFELVNLETAEGEELRWPYGLEQRSAPYGYSTRFFGGTVQE